MSSQQRKEIGRLTVQDIIAQTAQRNLKSQVGSSHACSQNSGVSTTDSHKDGVGNNSTGINQSLHPFFVLEANMVSLKKNIFLSALTSLTVSAKAPSSAGINSRHKTFLVLQKNMVYIKQTLFAVLLDVINCFRDIFE